MNLLTKQKQTHRLREQTHDGRGQMFVFGGGDKLGSLG